MGPLFRSAASCFSLMCYGYQDQSVFFTYARLYAFDHMVMTPSTPRCIVKASVVVVFEVDRYGVGRDHGAR